MYDRSPVQDAIRQWRRADAREAVALSEQAMWNAIEAKDCAALAIAYAKPQSLEDQRAKLLWAWHGLGAYVSDAEANPDIGPQAIRARRVLRRVIAAMRQGKTLPHAARELREAALGIEHVEPEITRMIVQLKCSQVYLNTTRPVSSHDGQSRGPLAVSKVGDVAARRHVKSNTPRHT